ncbi:MAG: hypothetical protein KGJ18_07320 [Gammaproteobacteria bacterium]|nr:hypothetical protein [Gammaproteobacteria bacterium]
MRKLKITIILLSASCLGLAACVSSPYGDAYPAGGYSYAPAAQYQAPSSAQVVAQAAFTAAEITIMQQYFQDHPNQLQALNTAASYANGGYYQTQGDNDQGDEEEHGQGHGHGHGWKSREGGLPPGIAKNLARGKPLPPGIAAQLQPLPPQLVQNLPPPPPGYRVFMLDGRILLVNMATQVISDVIANAILGH